MAANMLRTLRSHVLQFETRLLQVLGSNNPYDQPPPGFAVAAVSAPSPLEGYTPHAPQDAKSIIDSIFDGIAWLAVPKRRRSVQKMMMRRMGRDKIRKHCSRNHNIIACLECGHWHQQHTICGNCYSKVRDETEKMRAAMDSDDRMYNAPKTEVTYVYADDNLDDRRKYAGKYIVEMEKKRPTWWAQSLLSRPLR